MNTLIATALSNESSIVIVMGVVLLAALILIAIPIVKFFNRTTSPTCTSTYWKKGENRYEVTSNGDAFRITKSGRRIRIKNYSALEEIDIEDILDWVEDITMFNAFFDDYDYLMGELIDEESLDVESWEAQYVESAAELEAMEEVSNTTEPVEAPSYAELEPAPYVAPSYETPSYTEPEPTPSHETPSSSYSSPSSSSSYESSSSSSSDYSSSSDSDSGGGSDD